ncbi:MAG: DUF5615 family PIN-like protein [Firmicutes bacterium]|nr:DUF5615 family PIN-like protein [Bacillota bacterium]
MRFLANENIPSPSIRVLRDEGHNVISISEESPGISDSVVLARAHADQLVLITFDRDYGQLIYTRRMPPPKGLVYFRFTPYSPDEPAKRLLEVLSKEQVDLVDRFDRNRKRNPSSTSFSDHLSSVQAMCT